MKTPREYFQAIIRRMEGGLPEGMEQGEIFGVDKVPGEPKLERLGWCLHFTYDDESIEVYAVLDEPRNFTGRSESLYYFYQADGGKAVHDAALALIKGMIAADTEPPPKDLKYGPAATELDESLKVEDRIGYHESWNHPERWRHFFADAEFERAARGAIDVALPTVFIEHGDPECIWVGRGDFVAYPWCSPWERAAHNEHLWRDRVAEMRENGSGVLKNGIDPAVPLGLSLVTELRDDDVIKGGANRLEEILRQVNETTEPQMIYVNCNCVPEMIGDDFEDIVSAQSSCSTCPTILSPHGRSHMFGPHVTSMQDRLNAVRQVDTDPLAVNLLGFREGAGLDDLRRDLKRLGARPNVAVVPRMAPGLMDQYKNASLQVMLVNDYWQDLIDHVFGSLGMATIRPAPPYGIAGSANWLRAVANALELGEAALAECDVIETDGNRRIAPLIERARGRGVGIVLEPAQLAKLTDVAKNFSLPLVQLLDEFGYTVHFAIYSAPERDHREIEAGLAPLLQDPEQSSFFWFETEDELDGWLRDERHSLIYSDYLYDHRVTSAGKAIVSAQAFEMGLDGAIRSLERLLRLDQTGFYSAFGKYLKRQPALPMGSRV